MHEDDYDGVYMYMYIYMYMYEMMMKGDDVE